jgi:hypothetical protein
VVAMMYADFNLNKYAFFNFEPTGTRDWFEDIFFFGDEIEFPTELYDILGDKVDDFLVESAMQSSELKARFYLYNKLEYTYTTPETVFKLLGVNYFDAALLFNENPEHGFITVPVPELEANHRNHNRKQF